MSGIESKFGIAGLRRLQGLEESVRDMVGVAHDINNLLAVLIKSRIPEGNLGEVEHAEVGERIVTLGRRLMELGRGALPRPQPLDINDAISEVLEGVGRVFTQGRELIVSLAPERPVVSADRLEIQQLLLNLLSNARDATTMGQSIAIETDTVSVARPLASRKQALPPGRYVIMSVRDTGRGMAEQTLDHLFDAQNTSRTPEQGSGLGLFAARRVALRSSGQIMVTSRVDWGTKVDIYLPPCANRA